MARDRLDELRLAAQDYDRMADALAFLGDRWRDRPSYKEAAEQAGLSPYHFHRVFTRWAGLSPKRFVDAHAHAEARAALAEGASVLDASLDVGLSGPSRLHDLFIAFEAVTPGEAKRKGEGLEFVSGVAPTPFGTGVFLISPRGLSALAFADPGEEGEALADLQARFPAAVLHRDDEEAAAYAARIFTSGEPTPLALYGTPWQRQIWRALIDIPPGDTTTYGELAARVRAPSAARAVGAAVGRNPVSWLIPCHRVIASDGRLTGYHWGVRRKRAMLAFEAAHAEAQAA
ncbi:MAG: bifunctional helix-turn-helix domain-containing protein/methylated-DNA--[protein]-cysteine S-methyltransferase [Caulobacterales bacterium]|nr:bifunctional helix-turn-helix domain-containing protein/methylated-DNA--[protein]-cysteine S-methyltransferase [Caulobacterales bacterium]